MKLFQVFSWILSHVSERYLFDQFVIYFVFCFASSILMEVQEVLPEAECSIGINNGFVSHSALSGICFKKN